MFVCVCARLGEGLVEYEILKVLPFDNIRKMMSVIVRHPRTKEIILYSKGADSSIFGSLGLTGWQRTSLFFFLVSFHFFHRRMIDLI